MTTDPPPPSGPRWYCIRTRTKSEHLARARLEKAGLAEAYCPRIRFRRATTRGPVWFVEALFPGYLFARFDLGTALKAVLYTPGVTGIVHFGGQYVAMPDATITALRGEIGEAEIKIFDKPVEEGDRTTLLGGPFRGLEAVVTRVLPARERVRILIEFLGRAMEVEVESNLLAPADDADPLRARRGRKAGP